jgi:hypothetical protein
VSEPRWSLVNDPDESASLDLAAFLDQSVESGSNPIDEFYEYSMELIRMGDDASLSANESLGRLLLLGTVTGVELYVRRVLAGLVKVCPLCRDQCSGEQIHLGAVDHYDPAEIGMGLLENVSFSTRGEIAKRTERLTGVQPSADASLAAALDMFNDLCVLRHASVHARGNLGSSNLRELSITPSGKRRVVLGLPELHAALRTSYALVRSYNRYMHRKIVERWIGSRVLVGVWARDRSRYQPLYDLFASRVDGTAPGTAYNSYRSLRPAVLKAAGT